MLTWTANTVVRGVVPSTGATVLFVVTFDVRGTPLYTPVARMLPLGGQSIAEA